MAIRVGSRVRVYLPFEDEKEDGTFPALPINPEWENTLTVTRPDGTLVEDASLVITSASGGLAYWEGIVDAEGTWSAEGSITEPGKDPYISEPVYWRVKE